MSVKSEFALNIHRILTDFGGEMKMIWWKRNGGRRIEPEETEKNLADLPIPIVSAPQNVFDYLSVSKASSAYQLGDGVLYSAFT